MGLLEPFAECHERWAVSTRTCGIMEPMKVEIPIRITLVAPARKMSNTLSKKAKPTSSHPSDPMART